MNSLSPKSYEEALSRAESRPQKPRKPLARKSSLRSRVPVGSKSVPECTLRANKGISAKGRAGKKKSKKPKLMSRKRAIKVLDDLTSRIVRARDGCCVVTGSTDQLTCGHIFSRRSMATRFDISEDGNCHAQSWASNFRHTFDTHPYYRWYIQKFGLDAFDALHARWAKGKKISTPELREMIVEYQAKLESLQT